MSMTYPTGSGVPGQLAKLQGGGDVFDKVPIDNRSGRKQVPLSLEHCRWSLCELVDNTVLLTVAPSVRATM
jgi:hypothetical protein